MGKHSGRNAFRTSWRSWATSCRDNQFQDAFVRFKELADRKKHVYDEDIEALVDQDIATAHDRIKLVSLSVVAGTRGPQRATMKLEIDGKIVTEEQEGNGPVDATFNAIKALVPHEAVLELYQVHAVTEGTDAQAEVSVRLSAERPQRHLPRRRPGHAGRLGPGLSRRPQQAHEPRRAAPRSTRGRIIRNGFPHARRGPSSAAQAENHPAKS